MKRLAAHLFATAALAALAACGGAGGAGSPGLPSSPIPAATATPIVNTAVPSYLPLARGNFWSFSSGSSMVDAGTFWLTCICPFNYGLMEQFDIRDRFGRFGGSLFFAKQPVTGGSTLTTLIGVRRPGAEIVSLIYDSVFGRGLPVMDNAPTVGETWSLLAGDQLQLFSTITSVAGTVPIPGNGVVVNVASDDLSRTSSGPAVTMSFGQGVGFVAFALAGRTVSLSNFGISELRSTDLPVTGIGYLYGNLIPPADPAPVLVTLF